MPYTTWSPSSVYFISSSRIFKSSDRMNRLHKIGQQLYTNCSRERLLEQPADVYSSLIQAIPRELTESYLVSMEARYIGSFMDLGRILVRYYRKLEAQFPKGPVGIKKVSGIHEEIHGILSDCIGYFSERDLCLSCSHTRTHEAGDNCSEDRGPWRKYRYNF